MDLGAKTAFQKIILDTSKSTGDYPRGYAVYVSNDGSSWGDPIASGVGMPGFFTINFQMTIARYIRILQTGSTGNWWSIDELYVYGPRFPPIAIRLFGVIR